MHSVIVCVVYKVCVYVPQDVVKVVGWVGAHPSGVRRGIKWLYPALLQAMTIGEFNNPLVTHSSGG